MFHKNFCRRFPDGTRVERGGVRGGVSDEVYTSAPFVVLLHSLLSCLQSTSFHLHRDSLATDILHALRWLKFVALKKVPSLPAPSHMCTHGSTRNRVG